MKKSVLMILSGGNGFGFFRSTFKRYVDDRGEPVLFDAYGPGCLYPCSCFRISGGSTAVDRYIDPHAPPAVAVTGVDDREMLSLILMARHIISCEPDGA